VLLDLLKTLGEPIPENVDEAFILTEYAVQTRYSRWLGTSDEKGSPKRARFSYAGFILGRIPS
jgi:hypothetical protein